MGIWDSFFGKPEKAGKDEQQNSPPMQAAKKPAMDETLPQSLVDISHCLLNDLKRFHKDRLEAETDSNALLSFSNGFPLMPLLHSKVNQSGKFQGLADNYLRLLVQDLKSRMAKAGRPPAPEKFWDMFVRDARSSAQRFQEDNDVFDLESADIDLTIRCLGSGDIEFIGPGSIDLFTRILNFYRNAVLIEIGCSDLADTTDSTYDDAEFEEEEVDEVTEATDRRVAAILKTTSEIDYPKIEADLMAGIPSREMLSATRPHFIDEQEALELVRTLHGIRTNAGEIPSMFLKGELFNPHPINGFDVNQMLAACDAVHLQAGSTLDYVYYKDSHGGEPLIYARSSEETPLQGVEDFKAKFRVDSLGMCLGSEPTWKTAWPYTCALNFESTPHGYFQFALLCFAIRRFYLWDHSNYNERHYIVDSSSLQHFMEKRVNQMTQDDISFLRNLDFRPRVFLCGNHGLVKILNYEMNTGLGFLNIALKHPSGFIKFEDEVVIKSRTSILY